MPDAPLVSDKKLIRGILSWGKCPEVVPGAGSGRCWAVGAFVQHPDTANGRSLPGTGPALTSRAAAAAPTELLVFGFSYGLGSNWQEELVEHFLLKSNPHQIRKVSRFLCWVTVVGRLHSCTIETVGHSSQGFPGAALPQSVGSEGVEFSPQGMKWPSLSWMLLCLPVSLWWGWVWAPWLLVASGLSLGHAWPLPREEPCQLPGSAVLHGPCQQIVITVTSPPGPFVSQYCTLVFSGQHFLRTSGFMNRNWERLMPNQN